MVLVNFIDLLRGLPNIWCTLTNISGLYEILEITLSIFMDNVHASFACYGFLWNL